MSALEPYWADDLVTLFVGDCLDVLAGIPDASIDAVCTDPPYGLEFMGKSWDAPWRSGINADAGFSAPGYSDGDHRLPRPTFTGSTNPNCKNCGGRQRGRRDGTAIWPTCTCDAPAFPNVRATEMRAFQDWCGTWAAECLRVLKPGGHLLAFGGTRTWHRLACAVEDAGLEIRDSISWVYGSGFPKSKNLDGDRLGWGTALKPAHEPIVVARKPVAGTVAACVLANGTGALNIAGCRIPASGGISGRVNPDIRAGNYGSGGGRGRDAGSYEPDDAGRWPPNVLLTHSADCTDYACADDCPVVELDAQSGALTSSLRGKNYNTPAVNEVYGKREGSPANPGNTYGDMGGASRFFPAFRYEAKAPASERPRLDDGTAHPTVKPLALMRWLVRLVTPPGGLVLDPFAGSGTTGEACVIEGFRCILAEKDPAHAELIKARLGKPIQPDLFGGAA